MDSPNLRAKLLTQRGLTRLAQGQAQSAMSDFDTAIALDPGSPWSLNARAVTELQLGQSEAAIRDDEAAIQRKPDYAGAWSNLADARLAAGQFDLALAASDEALKRLQQHREIAWTARGKIWIAMGDWQRALTAFDEALGANPRYANALSGRAVAKFGIGDFDGAASDLEQAWGLRSNADTAVEWVIALGRAGRSSARALAEVSARFDAAQGLPPGIALFSGRLTPAQVLGSANDKDQHVHRQRQCSAQVQAGEWYLLHADLDRARAALLMAKTQCEPGDASYGIALAEWPRLGQRDSRQGSDPK
jgi:tetratricopeptide (TPR) repeat protein